MYNLNSHVFIRPAEDRTGQLLLPRESFVRRISFYRNSPSGLRALFIYLFFSLVPVRSF